MDFNQQDFAPFTHFKASSVAPSVVHVEVHRPQKLNSFDEE